MRVQLQVRRRARPRLKKIGGLIVGGLVGTLAPAEPGPDFATDIAPIIYQNCIDCHRPGGIGPFSLTDYPAVSRRARQIAEVVEDGYMPPWKPNPHRSPVLIGDRSLPPAAIDLIVEWAAAGAPAGDLSSLAPPIVPTQDWALGHPDLIIDFPAAYELAAEGHDVFQNFVLRIPLAERRFVRALEFLPEASLVIHHAVIAFDATPQSRQRDEADPGLGFTSMDRGRASTPNGHIIGWTPGQVPYEVYPGTAFELTPGTDLVVQLHLLPSGKPERVSPRVGLYFSDEPPTRSGFVALLREHVIDIPAGESAYPIREEFILPTAAAVLGLYPHAHYLGRDLQIYAEPPDGTRRWLMHIPDWDFNWQSDYRFATPLELPAGTKLVMAYTFDNSAANPRNPRNPPERVRGGWSSFDEMGEVAIQLLLSDRSDLPLLEEAQARYLIDSGEKSADTFYNLGLALDRQHRFPEAISPYENALRLDPTNAAALNNLGGIYERLNAADRAIPLYERALAADPALTVTRLNLAHLFQRDGRTVEAANVLRQGLALRPEDLPLRLALAESQIAGRNAAGALVTLEQGLPWHHQDPRLRFHLGQIRLVNQQLEAGLADLQAVTNLSLLTDGSVDVAATNLIRGNAYFALALLAQQRRDLPEVERRLADCLAVRPHHRDALLMSAGVAMIQDTPTVAIPHLVGLLQLPPDQRPTEDEVLGIMPFPDGVHVWAQALAATGQGDTAREFLARHAAEARQRGRPEWGELMESWLREL